MDLNPHMEGGDLSHSATDRDLLNKGLCHIILHNTSRKQLGRDNNNTIILSYFIAII